MNEDDLPLILTRMSTFLLHFQILQVSESNNKPKIANFCKNWLKMAKYETKSLSRDGRSYENDLPLILTEMSTLLLQFQILKWSESNIKPKIANFCKNWLKWLNMRQSHYLRTGRSYEDDLPLISTRMSTFLLQFQILKWSESNIKPKIANFSKKLAENG